MSDHAQQSRRRELHIFHHFGDSTEFVRPVLDYLHKIYTQQQTQGTKMSQMDDNITALQGSVANLTSVDQSAITLIQGFGAQVQAAVDAALAAGATQQQLQAMTDLKAAIDAQDDALAAAVTAGTANPNPGGATGATGGATGATGATGP